MSSRRRRPQRKRTRSVFIAFIVLCAVVSFFLKTISTLTETLAEERAVEVDLGFALHPEELPPELAVPRFWRVSSLRHKLSYGLGVSEETEIVVSYDFYKDRMRVRHEGQGYWHQAPPQCRADLRCAYDELVRSNTDAIRPIAERFVACARARQMSARGLARLIVAYVQSIEYRPVREDPYGLVPPAIVVNSSGDCDSKSLLAIMLMRTVGVDAVMIVSNSAQHAMVGVGLPLGQDRIAHRGRKYAMVEVTHPNWPIGRVPPKLASHSDWQVVPVRFEVPLAKE